MNTLSKVLMVMAISGGIYAFVEASYRHITEIINYFRKNDKNN